MLDWGSQFKDRRRTATLVVGLVALIGSFAVLGLTIARVQNLQKTISLPKAAGCDGACYQKGVFGGDCTPAAGSLVICTGCPECAGGGGGGGGGGVGGPYISGCKYRYDTPIADRCKTNDWSWQVLKIADPTGKIIYNQTDIVAAKRNSYSTNVDVNKAGQDFTVSVNPYPDYFLLPMAANICYNQYIKYWSTGESCCVDRDSDSCTSSSASPTNISANSVTVKLPTVTPTIGGNQHVSVDWVAGGGGGGPPANWYIATYPVDDTVNSLTPTFTWEAATPNIQYNNLCIGTDATCGTMSCKWTPATTARSFTLPAADSLQLNKDYYWMIYGQPGNPAPGTGCIHFKTPATIVAPTKTCSVSLAKTTVNTSEGITVNVSGTDSSKTESVYLWISKQVTATNQNATVPISPIPVTSPALLAVPAGFNYNYDPTHSLGGGDVYQYPVKVCEPVINGTCSGGVLINPLSIGNYNIACAVGLLGQAGSGDCHGAAYCSYEGGGLNCGSVWKSCGADDWKVLTVATPTTYYGCVNNTCAIVSGASANANGCTTQGGQCCTTGSCPTDQTCDTSTSPNRCVTPATTYYGCVNNTCAIVSGASANTNGCSSTTNGQSCCTSTSCTSPKVCDNSTLPNHCVTPTTTCNATTCPTGCCSASGCVAYSSQSTSACGTGGATCVACGSGQTCSSAGVCTNNTTTCNSSNCSGCCLNNVCQTGNTISACGTGAAACATCASTQTCTNGVCVTPAATCNSTNCTGCCSGTTCVAYASQTSSSCGTGGAACVACSSTQGCSPAGVCTATSTQVNACYGDNGVDGRCYDCNGDGVINVLDFSCFRKKYGTVVSPT